MSEKDTGIVTGVLSKGDENFTYGPFTNESFMRMEYKFESTPLKLNRLFFW